MGSDKTWGCSYTKINTGETLAVSASTSVVVRDAPLNSSFRESLAAHVVRSVASTQILLSVPLGSASVAGSCLSVVTPCLGSLYPVTEQEEDRKA